MLSDKKLKEIEDRVSKTTEGNWNIEPISTMSGAWFYINDNNGECLFESKCYATNKNFREGNFDNDENWHLNPEKWIPEPNGKNVYNDYLFVANAKSDMIALLEEVKRLKNKRIK